MRSYHYTRDILGLTVALGAAVPATASADHDCDLRARGTTLRLMNDCTTDATITIPDGMSLDGRGHRITAAAPPEGSFEGAVVANAGEHANVYRLTIDTGTLVCSSGTRPTGIAFEGASGSIVQSEVLDLRGQADGCSPASAVEVRGDGHEVVLVGNHLEGFHKTGLLASGDVEVSVRLNRILGLGASDRVAQNGVQLSDGARGELELNRVDGYRYTPGTFTSTAILLLGAGEDVEVSLNRVTDSDVGIYLASTSGAKVHANRIEGSSYDGIAVDGRSGPAEDNHVRLNDVRDVAVGIDLYGAGAVGNLVSKNRVSSCSSAGVATQLDADANQLTHHLVRDCAYGMYVDSDDNEVTHNVILNSSFDGLSVTGSGNIVSRNLVR